MLLQAGSPCRCCFSPARQAPRSLPRLAVPQRHSRAAVAQVCEEGNALSRPATSMPAFTAALIMALTPSSLVVMPDPVQATQVIQGPARVVDGDTLVIGSERIRLYGLDAPEKAQFCSDPNGAQYSCGQRSKEALTAKIGSQVVTCAVKNQDQYGRNVSTCTLSGGLLGNTEDINSWLVSNGYAVAYRQYGKEYIPLEEQAKAQHKGVWAGNFTPPAEWRKQQKAGSAAAPAAAPGLVAVTAAAPTAAAAAMPSCPGGGVIKGNIGSKGDKIYHVPGGKQYDQVKIDVADGERFFCTEAEAQAAGWRAAK